ncbi:MAG: hypothetical protein DRQ59_10615 [Gammaproteobacteria bacterium]|nr:MAG: hypothetical protein DRQ59_10615 [Gammaproteobacteria bacterium]
MHLYQTPAISGKEATQLLDVTPRAANGLIRQFVDLRIPEEVTEFQRNCFQSPIRPDELYRVGRL